ARGWRRKRHPRAGLVIPRPGDPGLRAAGTTTRSGGNSDSAGSGSQRPAARSRPEGGTMPSGRGGPPPPGEQWRNAWTHVVSPRGRIGVRTAPKRLRKVSKRGSAKDAAVERREASAQRKGAERLARCSGGFSADAHASAAVRLRCVRNAPAPLGASASLL